MGAEEVRVSMKTASSFVVGAPIVTVAVSSCPRGAVSVCVEMESRAVEPAPGLGLLVDGPAVRVAVDPEVDWAAGSYPRSARRE